MKNGHKILVRVGMKRALVCLLVIMIAMCSFTSAYAAQKKKDFVFIMDRSFTMRGDKFESMKENVIRAIDVIFSEDPNARIALIAYSVYAEVVADFQTASGAQTLKRTVENLAVQYDTQMTEALTLATTRLKGSRANQKVAVFFGDGVHSKAIDNINNIRKAASDLKSVANVYAVGIFQDIKSNELFEAEELMKFIASDPSKCYFTGSHDDLGYAIDDILDETVFDKNRIQITTDLACDLTITHNGETLDWYNTKTSFGRISTDGETNGKQIITLKNVADYDIVMRARDGACISYTISYSNADGVVTDTRSIMYLNIQKNSRIYTNTKESEPTRLTVDMDNDSVLDYEFTARSNEVTYVKRLINVNHPIKASISDKEVGTRIRYGMVNADATSNLPTNSNGDFHAYSAVDNDVETYWVEGVAGNGRGEKITFTFNETQVTGFVIQAGMIKNSTSYNRNTRVREMLVYVENESPITVKLADVMRSQIVVFDRPVETSYLTMELVNFYTSGTIGDDCCITDVWILNDEDYASIESVKDYSEYAIQKTALSIWDKPHTAVHSKGNGVQYLGTEIDSSLFGKVLEVQNEDNGWFKMIAAESGNYTFYVLSPDVESQFTIETYVDKTYEKGLAFEKSDEVQEKVLFGMEQGSIITWQNVYSDGSTVQTPFKMMITFEAE